MAKVQTSIQLDAGTVQAIDELKVAFGVTSNAAVIRKAVALSRVAAQNANKDNHTVTLIDNEGDKLKISLVG